VPDIWARNISKRFPSDRGEITVLQNMDFAIEEAEFVTVVGPSGSGKTTLLRILLGLETPSSGDAGIDPGRAAQGVAYVAQQAPLLPWRTLLQNVALGLELKRELTDARLDSARDLIGKFGLAGFEDFFADELSGGMRQRVAVIRALASNPKILLCDEPFTAIDFVERLRLNREMKFLCAVMGVTTIFVTHNIDEAIFLGHRVIVVSRRPATIVATYAPKLTRGHDDPVAAREEPEFQRLFQEIWRDLK